MTATQLDELVAALRAASSVFVLTGSGISAESGLPTFRGVGGLWRTHRVEELASPEGFARDPRLVWTWYNERKSAHGRAKPNAGHVALAQLECVDRRFHARDAERGFAAPAGRIAQRARAARKPARGALHALRRASPAARRGLAAERDRARLRRALAARYRLVRRAAAAGRVARRPSRRLRVPTSFSSWARAPSSIRPPRSRHTTIGSAFVAEINPEATAISERVDCALRGTAAEVLPQILTEFVLSLRGDLASYRPSPSEEPVDRQTRDQDREPDRRLGRA